MHKNVKRIATMSLCACMALAAVLPVNAATRIKEAKKSVNGYVLSTKAVLEDDGVVIMKETDKFGQIKPVVKTRAKWETQATYKGLKDDGKLTAAWNFSCPGGKVAWEAEGHSGVGQTTGGSKTVKADVAKVAGTLVATKTMSYVTMQTKASFKKGNTEYSVICKN